MEPEIGKYNLRKRKSSGHAACEATRNTVVVTKESPTEDEPAAKIPKHESHINDNDVEEPPQTVETNSALETDDNGSKNETGVTEDITCPAESNQVNTDVLENTVECRNKNVNTDEETNNALEMNNVNVNSEEGIDKNVTTETNATALSTLDVLDNIEEPKALNEDVDKETAIKTVAIEVNTLQESDNSVGENKNEVISQESAENDSKETENSAKTNDLNDSSSTIPPQANDEAIDVQNLQLPEVVDNNVLLENKLLDEEKLDSSADCSLSGNDNILITVNFHNNKVAEAFKDKILNALMVVKEFSIIDKVHVDNKLILIPNPDLDGEFDTSDDKGKKHKRKHDKKEKEDLFVVDTKPSNKHENMKLQYSTKFSLDRAETIANNGLRNLGPMCFNCAEKHNLRDCPYPKDFVRINKAKTKTLKPTRYHLDEDQKYDTLKPGKLSNKLREALGLRRNEMPLFTYRMRTMGYPPGWVEEAFDANSDLALFDCDGKALDNAVKKEIKINPDKIVEYPGFNAPLEKHIKDEHKLYAAVRYSKHINKDSIMEAIKKLKDDLVTCDMDIDEGEEEEKLAAPGCEEYKENRQSPTLNDLEEEKLKLLAELGDTSSTVKDDKETKEINAGESSSKNVEIDEIKDDLNASTDLEIVKADVKTSSFGTPILDRKYPYSKLPNPDNFSLNISPVINFENLPNSTGKFEQMVGVLQKVRRTLKNLENPKL